MNNQDKAAIERFVRRVATGLWLQRFQRHIALGFKIGAFLLLTAGLMHVFFHLQNLALTAAFALSPILAGIGLACKHKPSRAYAAAHADELFDGKSLMTTAVEVLDDTMPAAADFSPWLLRQAARAADAWQERLDDSRHPRPRLPWTAIGAACLGMFFLSQPAVTYHTVESASETLKVQPPRPTALAALIEQLKTTEPPMIEADDYRDNAGEAPAAGNDPSLPDADKKTQPNGPLVRTDNSFLPHENAAEQLTASIEANNPGHQPQSSDTGPGTGIGDRADRASPAPRPNSAEHGGKPIKRIDIALKGGNQGVHPSKTSAFTDHRFKDAYGNPMLRPPNKTFNPEASLFKNHFSPSQQRYIIAYFKHFNSEK